MEDTSSHVLIIAAQPTVRLELEELLRAYGYAVTSVSGTAAVPADAAPETWAAVLVASTLPQTDRSRRAPSDLAEEALGWVPK